MLIELDYPERAAVGTKSETRRMMMGDEPVVGQQVIGPRLALH